LESKTNYKVKKRPYTSSILLIPATFLFAFTRFHAETSGMISRGGAMKTVPFYGRTPAESMADFTRAWTTGQSQESARISFATPELHGALGEGGLGASIKGGVKRKNTSTSTKD